MKLLRRTECKQNFLGQATLNPDTSKIDIGVGI
jgi:hypothetical protein